MGPVTDGDLTPPPHGIVTAPQLCDFLLWGRLKANSYKEKPLSLEKLKAAIINQTDFINKHVLVKFRTIFEKD